MIVLLHVPYGISFVLINRFEINRADLFVITQCLVKDKKEIIYLIELNGRFKVKGFYTDDPGKYSNDHVPKTMIGGRNEIVCIQDVLPSMTPNGVKHQ